MSNLEDRLRSELSREGAAANVGAAPSVDALATVATGRRRRNRRAGIVAGAAVAAGLVIGGAFALMSNQASDVVAVGSSAGETAGEVDSQPEVANDAATSEVIESPADDSEPVPVEDSVNATTLETADDEPSDIVSEPLVADATTPADVETRASAVDFFGSSGVLIVPTADGLAGIASRFTDSGIEAIGLVSPNGLDWEEVALTGIPDGAAATALESFAGTHVATFDRNVLGERSTWVGTSTDLVNWKLSDPLEGDFVVAQQLLVGPNGVVVLGDIAEPDVWSGPIGGPYEVRDQVPTFLVGPAAVIDGEFVVLGAIGGFDQELLRSTDGVNWTSEPFDDPVTNFFPAENSGSTLTQDGAALVLTANEGTASYVSNDLGETWTEIEHGGALGNLTSTQALSSNEATAILAGSDSLTVVLADDESVSIAEVPDVGVVNRSSLVSVEADRAVVLVETEAGLTWVVVSR